MYSKVLKKKVALLQNGEKISPSMEPHEDGRNTYNGVGPGYTKVSFKTMISLPHVTQARVEYESKDLRVTDEVLDLWEALELLGHKRKIRNKIVKGIWS